MLYVIVVEQEYDGGNVFYDDHEVTALLDGPDGLDFEALRDRYRAEHGFSGRWTHAVPRFLEWLLASAYGLQRVPHAVITL